jgi:cell division protein FtsQ
MSTKTVRQGTVTRKRKSRVPWLVWLIIIVGVVAWWVLYQSRWFLIENVKVVGVKRVTVATVEELAHVRVGEPLISVNPGEIEHSLTSIPQIKSSHAERGWPHTVIISVTERMPVAAVKVARGFDLVDDEGMLAGHVAVKPSAMRVVVAKPNTPAMLSATQVLLALPAKWKVASISAPTQDSVVVALRSGETITFGSGEQVAMKVKVAVALLADHYRNINVSSPMRPTVK